MNLRNATSSLLLLSLACTGGCLTGAKKPSTQLVIADPVSVEAPTPQGAQQVLPEVVYVDMYRLAVPYGTVSNNEAFWKQLNEHAIDFGTSELLWKNGIRAGVAANRDWGTFKQLIDENPASVNHQTYIGKAAEDISVVMTENVPLQNLFIFENTGRLVGRTYENSQYIWTMSFRRVPTKPDVIRGAISPMVRATRRRLEWEGRNGKPPQFVQAEQIYDVNLRVDVPDDSFLIVAPSSDARRETSIGYRYLTSAGAGEQNEYVFLFVPRSAPVVPSGNSDSPQTNE